MAAVVRSLSIGFVVALAAATATSQDAPPPTPSVDPKPADAKPAEIKPAEKPKEPRGVKRREPGALPGYTLLAPLRSTKIYLVDLDGRVVHSWDTKYTGGMQYLLDNGNLLRCTTEPDSPRFQGGGEAGRLQELAWDGTLLWDWKFATDEHLQHHDLTRMPDGNLLFIAWQYKSRADAVAAGRHPAHVGKDGIWPDSIVEIEPIRPDGAEIVWEWHVWDHLIQDLDPDAENYGNVGEHPELLDVNADLRRAPPSDAQIADMKALGYIDAKATGADLGADWLHLNGIDYHAELDQIVVSTPHLNEIWILDHSTTSDEAAGHEGGSAGRGGDFLHRWGNPRNYGAGGVDEQRLFGQHNPSWIRSGLPGAGHMLVYNNGGGRPDGEYSSVLELALPLKPDRTYGLEPFVAAGPAEPVWSYVAPNKTDFFSNFISGAQRLSNGNTLICEGRNGRVFEVTAQGAIVWEYLNPLGDELGDVMPGVPGHALFRATRIPADHPGLAGKELRPLQ